MSKKVFEIQPLSTSIIFQGLFLACTFCTLWLLPSRIAALSSLYFIQRRASNRLWSTKEEGRSLMTSRNTCLYSFTLFNKILSCLKDRPFCDVIYDHITDHNLKRNTRGVMEFIFFPVTFSCNPVTRWVACFWVYSWASLFAVDTSCYFGPQILNSQIK